MCVVAQSWAMLQHDIIGPGDHSAPPRQDFPCVSGGPAEGDVQEALQQLQQQLQNGEGQGAGAGEAAAPHGSSSSSAMATESRHVPGAAGRPEAGALSVQAPQQQHQLSQRSSQRPLQPVASSIVDEEDDLDLQYALQMSLLDLGGASPLDQMGPQQGNGNGDASSAAAAAAGNAAAAAAGGAGAAMQDLQALAVLLAERRQLVQAQARLLQGGSAAPPLLQRSSPRAQDDEDSGSLVERSSVSISSNRSDGKREPLGPPSRTASASPLGPS